jgi:succinate dehydrogenase / fumarate reductase cytochrome b subunit
MTSSIGNRHFLARRIHSLLGLLPISGFMMFHLYENSQSRQGEEHFNELVVKIESMNYVLLAEIFVLALPILAHAVYGLWITWEGRPNMGRYGYARNWMYWLQRFSGLAVFVYLIVHVGGTRIFKIFDAAAAENLFGRMQDILENPLWFAFYVIGLLLSLFHMCNGLWTFGIVWGVTTTPRAQRISFAACTLLFAVLSFMGVHGLLGFVVQGLDFI